MLCGRGSTYAGWMKYNWKAKEFGDNLGRQPTKIYRVQQTELRDGERSSLTKKDSFHLLFLKTPVRCNVRHVFADVFSFE